MSEVETLRDLAHEVLTGEEYALEQPISQLGLSIIPIVRTESPDPEIEIDYLTTSEAIESGVLEIRDAGDAVNLIIARNTGTKPVLIEEGEVLRAEGSQDRMVISSVILQPWGQIRIPVKCVHAPHGLRRGAIFATMGVASEEVRSTYRRHKYQSIMTDVEHYRPEAAVGQGEVWDSVATIGAATGGADPTKYADALENKRREVTEAAKHIKDNLPEHTCGLLVIDSDGKPIFIEFYRSTRAFSKRQGLIESVAMMGNKDKKKGLPKKKALERARETLTELKDIPTDKVVKQKDADNLHIGLGKLQGEAVVGEVKDKLKKIFYCSLGL
jgi:hypothetical protein